MQQKSHISIAKEKINNFIHMYNKQHRHRQTMSNTIKHCQTPSNTIKHRKKHHTLTFYTLIFPGGLHLESVFFINFSIISFPFLFITRYFGIPNKANSL